MIKTVIALALTAMITACAVVTPSHAAETQIGPRCYLYTEGYKEAQKSLKDAVETKDQIESIELYEQPKIGVPIPPKVREFVAVSKANLKNGKTTLAFIFKDMMLPGVVMCFQNPSLAFTGELVETFKKDKGNDA